MTSKKKHIIRIVFDILDETSHNVWLTKDLSVSARDPDEAIDWVFAEMQRQFKRDDIRLARVRICA